MNTETTTNNNQGKDIKGFKVVFNGKVWTVLKRKNDLGKKPAYYLYDTRNKTYLSSLYHTGETNTFIFDVKETKEQYLIRFFNNEGNNEGYEIEPLK